MKTELNITDPPVVAGQSVDMYRYKLAAFRVHKVLEGVSRLQIAMLECDSNNTSAEVSPRDTRNFWLAIAGIVAEWAFALKHKDAPTGTHENIFQIALPEPGEIQTMKNGKLKSCSLELQNFASVCLGAQAADAQVWVGNPSADDITKALEIVKEILLAELGTGEPKANGEDNPQFETGRKAPDFSFIGELVPPPHEAAVVIREPSKDAQPPNIPDAPDTS